MNTPRHQRGAMALAMAILLIGLISILSLVTVAQYYWAKRDAQKVADMAALSAAQHFKPNCVQSTAESVTNANASANWGTTAPDKGITPQCGNWNPATNASVAPNTYFIAGASSSAPANAIKVVAHVTPNTIIPEVIAGNAFQISAAAIATNQPPVAAFSVGSQLLQLHADGILPGLLKMVGLNVDGTGLVGYKGLANVRIKPSGLLHQLCKDNALTSLACVEITATTDIGTLNNLLAAQNVSIGQLVSAVATLAGQHTFTNATVKALAVKALDALVVHAEAQGECVQLGTTDPQAPDRKKCVQLGTAASRGTPRGLFAYINTATVQSALDAKVNVLDILNTSLQIANSQHAIDLTAGNLSGSGVTLLGGVKLWATIIEPPSIAIGGPLATAYTAQVRIGLRITTDAIPALGPVLSLLDTNIDIPLVIDVVNGKGVLQGKGPENKQLCDHDALGPYATIHATSRLLNVCISNFDPQHLGSTSESCEDDLKNADLVTVLGIHLISGSTHIQGFTGKKDLSLHVGETGSVNVDLDVGNTVDSIIKGVLQLLAGQEVDRSDDSTQHSNQPVDTSSMAKHLWNGQFIDYYGTTVDCGKLSDSNSDGNKRTACRDAVLTKLHDNASLQNDESLDFQVTGLLPGVVDLLSNVGDSLSDILDGLVGALFGNGCGSALLGHGSSQACMDDISDALAKSQTTENGQISNSLLALLGPVLNVLQPVLGDVGEDILKPLITMLLGADIGRTDVHLMSLQCQGAQLVY